MLDYNDLVVSIKKAALDAVHSQKQTGVFFGKVINISPLQICVEQKIILNEAQLVLTRSVTDFTMFMTVDHSTNIALSHIDLTHLHQSDQETELEGSPRHKHAYKADTKEAGYQNLTHSHPYVGTKPFLVHNALVVGDEVILMQMQGGQKFIVLDRKGVTL